MEKGLKREDLGVREREREKEGGRNLEKDLKGEREDLEGETNFDEFHNHYDIIIFSCRLE